MRLFNRVAVTFVATAIAVTGLAGFTGRVPAQHPAEFGALKVIKKVSKPPPKPKRTTSSSPTATALPTSSASSAAPQSPTPLPSVTVSVTPSASASATARASDALSSHAVFGASVPDLPYGRVGLPALESQLGRPLGVVSSYVDWSYVIGGPNELFMANGGARKVLLSWEPFGIRFSDVTSGAQDSYLQQVATSMKAFPYDVYVRPWAEMNGHWSTWQPTASGSKADGGTPAQFVAAWRYVVNFMRTRGVTHLKFVFSVDAANSSLETPIGSIWPGSSYVDVLGIDGYNWGNSALGANDTGDRWRSFDTIFTPMYGVLTSIDSTAPVWITEFGSKEPAVEDNANYPAESAPADPTHSKGAWFTQLMASPNFPRVTALVYFDKKKERDWRLDSSADSLSAIRRLLQAG